MKFIFVMIIQLFFIVAPTLAHGCCNDVMDYHVNKNASKVMSSDHCHHHPQKPTKENKSHGTDHCTCISLCCFIGVNVKEKESVNLLNSTVLSRLFYSLTSMELSSYSALVFRPPIYNT